MPTTKLSCKIDQCVVFLKTHFFSQAIITKITDIVQHIFCQCQAAFLFAVLVCVGGVGGGVGGLLVVVVLVFCLFVLFITLIL